MVRMVRVCGVEPATWSITHPFPVLCYRHSTRHVKQRTRQIPLAPPPSLWLYFHPRRVRLLVFLTPLTPKVQNLYSEWAEERNGLPSHIQSPLTR